MGIEAPVVILHPAAEMEYQVELELKVEDSKLRLQVKADVKAKT